MAWNVGVLRNGNLMSFHICAGEVRGYFYCLTPNHQTKFATYCDANTCRDFDIPVADMIAAGGTGTWTAAIFDVNDLSYSKAYMSFILNAAISINVTSNPSGASVSINGHYAGITPFRYAPDINDLVFIFTLQGYQTVTISGHYTTSTTVNANMYVPPPPLGFSLRADKTNVKPGDTVVFTTTGQDGSIWLYEKGLLGDYSNKIGVADAINGVATFTINPTGTHAYKAAHNPVPGANDCTLLCSWSNEVNVSTGTDWMMIAVYGIAAIVATIIASQFIGGRK